MVEVAPPADNGGSKVYNSKGYGYEANADNLGIKKKAELRDDLAKLAAGGEAAKELIEEDKYNDDGTENQAYTGMFGKSGYSAKNNKIVAKFAALPPPGHDQWNNIPGNENLFLGEDDIEQQPIFNGMDSSIAHIAGVGQGFKNDKRGVKVCKMWQRGMCSFGDRCIFNHGEVLYKSKFQDQVDMNIPPDERDMIGYRIAKQNVQPKGGDEQARKLENTTDWYSSDSKEVNLKSGDMDAIKASIEESRKVVSSGMLETDFTQEKKKKSRWN